MATINELLDVHVTKRDPAWENSFLKALPGARVKLMSPEPRQGPDHWPYLFVDTENGDEPLVTIVKWLSERGIGLAVNPQKTTPDFVLSYGMIWNFRERGEFMTPQKEEIKPGAFAIQGGQQVLTGAPSEAYLPKYARALIKQFLLDQGIMAPKVLLVSFDEGKNFDLCFSLESLKSPPAEEHQGIAEALAWFLPTHYAVGLISEKTVPGFAPL